MSRVAYPIKPQRPLLPTMRVPPPAVPANSPESRSIPQLLVSVRSPAEWSAAKHAGVDIVDLKEPLNGPLAAADPSLWKWVDRGVEGEEARSNGSRLNRGTDSLPLTTETCQKSVALGEWKEAVNIASAVPASFDFAKAGPSSCVDTARLAGAWTAIRRQLPDAVELVAVAYADWQRAECPPPQAIFQAAAEFGFSRCLIDTWTKDGRSIRDFVGDKGLAELGRTASRLNLWWVMAGSLTDRDAAELMAAGVVPDCFGVRGDVCDTDRVSPLSVQRIKRWKQLLGGGGSFRPVQTGQSGQAFFKVSDQSTD